MAISIADIRRSYSKNKLTESQVDPDPIRQFGKWWKQALRAEIVEPNAMTLATSSASGLPSARIVLLKGFSEKGFIFFTNYASRKGKDLAQNPRASLVFFWKELERQVRISGSVVKLSAAASDTYFQSRPRASQLGAAVSPQSQVIKSRQWLEDAYSKVNSDFENGSIVRPNYWGGYLVRPVNIEFWQGRPNRLHDRIRYRRLRGTWRMERLAP